MVLGGRRTGSCPDETAERLLTRNEPPPRTPGLAVEPEHRTILAVDIEAFGTPARTDPIQLARKNPRHGNAETLSSC
jgi:hypothetical protein